MDPAVKSLAEDLQELQFERSINKALKSPEELEKVTVDENLTDIERAVYLLSSGQEVSESVVINNLPDLLRDNHDECMRRVVPKVREVLHVAQAEMQLAASSAFLQILQNNLVPLQNYTKTFLQTILNSVDCRDPDVANAWLETLLDVIELLPKDVIKKDILSIAIAKGQLSQSVQSRLSCCKILGKIATRFEPFVIKKEILPVVQSLCQDVDYEVRGCMCRQLDPVARGLGLEATKSDILTELVELTKDEESFVRIAGIETVVNIISLLDEETCCSTIIPLVCKFCQQSLLAEDSTLPVVAKEFGRLCHGLIAYFTEENKEWLLDYFRKLCRVGLSEKNKISKDQDKESPTKIPYLPDLFDEVDWPSECRKNSAFNFPAMVLFIGFKNFKSELHSTFSSLCKDDQPQVRRTMALSFHEIVNLLGVSANILQGDLTTLLKDESIEVLQGIISKLPETLDILATCGGTQAVTDAKMSSLSEIIPAILSAELVVFGSNNWRLQEELMSNLSGLPRCLPSESIHQKIIPVLFEKLKNARALPVRHAVARTALIIIRTLKRQDHREELIHSITEDFGHGKSYHRRSLFIDICRFVTELYSKAFFKEYFFSCALELHTDPVANIRLRFCSILPEMKRQIKLPTDRSLLQQLEQCVRKLLIGEKDRDVSSAVKLAVEELDKIQVQMDLTRRMFYDEDSDDRIKEEEEKKLIELANKEKKEEESSKAAKGEKIKNGSSKIPGPKKGVSKSGTKVEKSDVKRVPSTSSSTQKESLKNGLESHLSRLVKSKSTNCISQIPRRDHPSRIPLKPKNYLSSSRTELDQEAGMGHSSASGLSATAPGSATGRRGSTSNIPAARRGSVGSTAVAGNSESSRSRKGSNGSLVQSPQTKTKKTSK
ncbi:hypothetical protein ScPMuIL_013830 [Solemya velum]